MEFRLYGPPGTGKTTRLATRDVPRAVEKFSAEKVMVTSFTRTAAREIAMKRSRETGLPIGLPPENIGTIHSICFRALGQPKITEVNFVKDWNAKYPSFAISGKVVDFVDECNNDDMGTAAQGDMLLNAMNIKRNKMIPESAWPPRLRIFKNQWDNFKTETGSIDFTGMIEKCLTEMPYAPGLPKVLFVDEAQDFTKLQLSLCRSWANQLKFLVLTGDDDQTIYSFSGADSKAFLLPDVPENMKTVLRQSYRVPQSVLNRSLKLIEKVTLREPKKYAARKELFSDHPAQGKVVEMPESNWKKPDPLVDLTSELIKIEDTNKPAVMILASCGYMLEPIRYELLKRGIPFYNPYRTHGKARRWNPLLAGTEKINTSRDILEAFIGKGIDNPFWNVPQFLVWARHLSTGDSGWISGRKQKSIKFLEQAITKNDAGLHTTRNLLPDILTSVAIEQAVKRNLDWFSDNLISSKTEKMEYAIKTFKQFGMKALEENPRIVIGTIHSFKGAEAHSVILFPDVSWQADAEIQQSQQGREAAYRLFYVGMTRAYENLFLTGPAMKSPGKEPRMFVEL